MAEDRKKLLPILASENIKITTLHVPGSCDGTYIRFSPPWLEVYATSAVRHSSAVQVEHKDVLFLGDVVNSTEDSGGWWRLQVKVAHTLGDLQDLRHFHNRFINAA